jgi:hypothetical protein
MIKIFSELTESECLSLRSWVRCHIESSELWIWNWLAHRCRSSSNSTSHTFSTCHWSESHILFLVYISLHVIGRVITLLSRLLELVYSHQIWIWRHCFHVFTPYSYLLKPKLCHGLFSCSSHCKLFLKLNLRLSLSFEIVNRWLAHWW